ncbi:reverse transcriptase [Purpureocillium lavendulum]|uniref:Reverse transcriptase n=1 Tax=Purpureocillium lavendulum TaxID=1247861 RepID=A0AB34FCF4_9HYPO|nr:reverse transcriptase [Purpureocillium lavendulum]
MRYTEADIHRALEAVASGGSVKKASRDWGVPRATLYNRMNGHECRKDAFSSLQRLSQTQEKQLTKWILVQDALGLPPTHSQIRQFAQRMLAVKGDNIPLGKHWMQAFLRHNPAIRTQKSITEIRRVSMARLLRYNMDEAGIMEGLGENGLVVGSAVKRSVQKKTPGSRVWTSFIECVSATGTFLPPLVIFKGKSVQQQWFPEDLNGGGMARKDVHSKDPAVGLFGAKTGSIGRPWEPRDSLVGFLSLLTDSSAVGKQNFLSCYQIAREQALTVSNIKGGWKATGLWPVSVAKPLLSPLLLENSNKRKNDAKNTHTAFRSPFSTSEWQTDASQIAWSTPKRPQDLKVQVLQFNQLDDDVPTKRLLFRKITKGFDEKDGLLAKAQLQIQALETQLPAVKPKKRKRVETSPNSRFADIEAVQRAQAEVNAAEKGDTDGTEDEISEIGDDLLDTEGNVLPGAAEALGAENGVSIAKMSWLSNKQSGKAYGSMVIYVTKGSDARRLLDGHYFDLAGESAITNVFEPRKGPVRCYNCQNIGHKSFQCKYAQNRRKREPVQQSLMNDVELKDYGVLAVSEPYARLVDGRVVTSPMWHSNWTKMIPTQQHDGPWPIRSMLWVRSDIEAEQLPIPSADLTAAVLRLPERDVLVVSVRTDVVLIGDFNRHDLLWTGDDVSAMRQGEAEPIIDLMNEHGLCSLLPRGTRTWQGQDQESTIDLVLATSELADTMVTCVPHPTDHGSDHRAIQTTFDVELPERVATPRLLFKNAPWNLIRARVEECLRALPRSADVQAQADQLMGEAAKEYHDGIRRQRKAHWDDFLAEDTNIWKAAKYLEPGKDAMGDKVPPQKKAGGTMTRNRAEQAEQLLDTFFPPPPARIEEEGLRPQRRAVAMPALTLEEVEVKVMAAKPWKAAGTDGLPAMVWRQLWPVVKHRALALFRASLREGVVHYQTERTTRNPLCVLTNKHWQCLFLFGRQSWGR